MRVSFFFLVARCVCLCPDNFYKPPGENICIACPACALSQVTPCGGDSPGLCAAGLDVSLQISSADSLNASLLPNHTFFSARSDVFIQPVQAPGLLISLLASGAASLNATALLPYRANVTILPDTIVSASLVPCTQPNTFRSARTFQCLPCSNCSEYDVFVANCTPVQDTLCRGSIHLDYMVINPFDPDNTLPVQLDVQAIPCPSGQYRQRQTGICIPCSVCQQGAIPLVPCSLQDDTRLLSKPPLNFKTNPLSTDAPACSTSAWSCPALTTGASLQRASSTPFQTSQKSLPPLQTVQKSSSGTKTRSAHLASAATSPTSARSGRAPRTAAGSADPSWIST